MGNINIKHILQRLLDILNSWVAKFQHLSAIRHQDMVVLSESIGFFILGEVLTKLVPGHKITFYQQVKRIVYGSPTYPVVFVFHADVQSFHIEMTRFAVNLLQYGIALRRFAQGF